MYDTEGLSLHSSLKLHLVALTAIWTEEGRRRERGRERHGTGPVLVHTSVMWKLKACGAHGNGLHNKALCVQQASLVNDKHLHIPVFNTEYRRGQF